MIRGIFVERGLPARWKNVAYTFGELMKLVGDRLYRNSQEDSRF